MSSISAAASTLLSSTSFRGHGHRKGAHATSSASTSATGSGGGSGIGQLPVSASTSLFSGLVQSFEQAIGGQSTSPAAAAGAASATPPASSAQTIAGAASRPLTAATPAQGQELRAFQHSLLQALKQDGLSSNGTGNIVSSLQSLIQQVGPNGKPTAATETLSSTFQNLVNGLSGGAPVAASSAGGAPSGPSSNAGLQSFLNNLLQNVQAGGTQALSASGRNVNTHV